MSFVVIARIHTDFAHKFGVPRQSGTPHLVGRIVFEPPYNNPDALRGIEGYSHLWLLWGFSQGPKAEAFAPTVRPPRLGGNVRMGVFATRSPNRPNPIGLSVVRLVEVQSNPAGPVLVVEGVDMVDGTPIYDIKPYLPYVDCIADATGGWGAEHCDEGLQVVFDPAVPIDLCEPLQAVLGQDPRPHYHEDGRVYGMTYAGYEVKFVVNNGVLTVLSATKEEE